MLLFTLFMLVLSNPLTIKPDGTFKIMQIADAHFENADSKCENIEESQKPCTVFNTTNFITKAIAAEKPDFIIYTGDNIDFDSNDAHWSMDQVFKPTIDYGKPWAAVLGNHDFQAQHDKYSRQQIIEYIMKMPNTLTQMGPENIRGAGNYKLQLFDQKGDVKWNFFMLDSMSTSDEVPVGVWDWMHIEKVEWYVENSDISPKVIPAMHFFHIPLVEYETVWPLHQTPIGINCNGDHQETVCCSKINSGMYSAYLTQDDVKLVFVGHDHTNDYCCLYNGVTLCYGGGCGYTIYGKTGWPRRIRIIEVQKNGDVIVSWKRLDDGKLSKTDERVLWFKVVE